MAHLSHGETGVQETTHSPRSEMMEEEHVLGWHVVVNIRDEDRVLHVLVSRVGGDSSVIFTTTVHPIQLKVHP